ncbi:V8-like Glu-specific endopeptidase [Cylindrospermum stagnale PCC 7417]|uniref:Serine protease n=1 Tax=Cylindrospermum stagnale PCC 7417 TaxID=56107 RepID=K9WZT2_9NOST|nr:trypsin-like peptidase domain-containing protein [Cylindrospermum stagnale]AFZ25017.1 V8-like Glu-specific endopeptidase [Cylindrospermum stagnale PCC 7417]
MTVQLSPPDFQRLTRVVQNLPDFANVRDRRRLVVGALEGVPQADVILARLDLDGAPMGVSVEIVRFLSQFGQVAYGKEALAVFLNYIQPYTGDQDKDFIIELFQKYPLNFPVSPSREIDNWRGTTSLAEVQEKIIGENTLRHIYILNLAFEAAKAVVHISTPTSLGTGFMITPDLLMTNNHVIASQIQAEETEYTFNYQLNSNSQECTTHTVKALPEGAFYTNSQLDFAVVNLKDVPEFGNPLILKSQQMRRDDRVAIIQHPGGHLKKISMQNNFVAYADSQILQYTTSTLPGSSGSPVFNDDFEVVAIHHSGGILREPGTNQRSLRNAGTSAIALLLDLKHNAPKIYNHLSR